MAKGHKRFLKKQGIPLPFCFRQRRTYINISGRRGSPLLVGARANNAWEGAMELEIVYLDPHDLTHYESIIEIVAAVCDTPFAYIGRKIEPVNRG